jgi:cell division protein ZapA (FtsZ GTPase activity inhibitor)
MPEAGDDDSRVETLSPDNVFVDTSILLNYAQRVIERDHTSPLIDSDDVEVVVGVTVADELEDVQERRKHIYEDFLEYLIDDSKEIGEYDPASRRPYFQENDERHVRNIQMELSQLDDRRRIQRNLRHALRSIERRLSYLVDEVIPGRLFDQQPGLTVLFALQDVISNDNDRNVVGDAALWSAEGEMSSGVFATMDLDDLLEPADEINQVLKSTKGEEWMINIAHPKDLSIVDDDRPLDSSIS